MQTLHKGCKANHHTSVSPKSDHVLKKRLKSIAGEVFFIIIIIINMFDYTIIMFSLNNDKVKENWLVACVIRMARLRNLVLTATSSLLSIGLVKFTS